MPQPLPPRARFSNRNRHIRKPSFVCQYIFRGFSKGDESNLILVCLPQRNPPQSRGLFESRLTTGLGDFTKLEQSIQVRSNGRRRHGKGGLCVLKCAKELLIVSPTFQVHRPQAELRFSIAGHQFLVCIAMFDRRRWMLENIYIQRVSIYEFKKSVSAAMIINYVFGV